MELFLNGMVPKTFLQSRIKLRLQVEIRFHNHVVIFPATFFFTKLSHEITRVRTVHDMLTTPSVYSLRNAHFFTERQGVGRLPTKTPTQTCTPHPCTPGTSWRCGAPGVVLDGGRSAEPAYRIHRTTAQLG